MRNNRIDLHYVFATITRYLVVAIILLSTLVFINEPLLTSYFVDKDDNLMSLVEDLKKESGEENESNSKEKESDFDYCYQNLLGQGLTGNAKFSKKHICVYIWSDVTLDQSTPPPETA